MKNILVSGLITIETTAKIENFPVNYSPVDYQFFGIGSTVSGVGFNVAKAIKTLGGNPVLLSITGNDFFNDIIKGELKKINLDDKYILPLLTGTSQSVILYNEAKRKIILDLKNAQETKYPAAYFNKVINQIDIAVLCNINFSRDMLKTAKDAGKIIASDVHVIHDINDEYNRDFLFYSDIIFLSNEMIQGRETDFIKELAAEFNHTIIVIGMGGNGLLLYDRKSNEIKHYPAVKTRNVVNTIGAGDALFSSFIYFYAKTNSVHYSIEKAVLFASYKIGEKGAAEGFLREKELLELKTQ